jgi:hypothetical protein
MLILKLSSTDLFESKDPLQNGSIKQSLAEV